MNAMSVLSAERQSSFDQELRPLVIPFEHLRSADAPRVGGKGASLGELLKAAIPVPPGFCVTTDAFQQFLAAGHDLPQLWAALTALQSPDIEAVQRVGASIRERLAAVAMPANIERAIVAAWQSQGIADAYAVRSSATAEDGPRASFAGQGETLLNVRGREAILESVRACWISLFTDRAILYRIRAGIDHRGCAMAVVVQKLIAADLSGVLFTADPVTGNRQRMVIEAAYGLGAALVSGQVSPDRVVLSRPGLAVIERQAGNKSRELTAAAGPGLRERPVAPQRASDFCLDGPTTVRLGTLALQAERALGSPQDIEWAMAGPDLFMLQSRPITTLTRKTDEPRGVWSSMNSWEVLPGVATPMSWSVLTFYIEHAFGPQLKLFGVDIRRQPLFDRIAGRAYANLNTYAQVLAAVPGLTSEDLVAVLGGDHGKLLVGELLGREPDDGASRLRRLARLPRVAVWFARHAVARQGSTALANFRRAMDKLSGADVAAMPETELLAHIAALLRLGGRFGDPGAAYVTVAMTFIQLFFRFTNHSLGRGGDEIANRLLSGVNGLASAEAGWELRQLAAWVSREPRLSAALADAHDFASLGPLLGRGAESREFFRRWQQFMRRHGHHAWGEMDVHNPRWSETPDQVLAMLRGQLGAAAANEEPDARKRLARQRAALANDCRRRLGNPFRILLFDFLYRRAQGGLMFRENVRNEMARVMAAVRRALAELGQRLVGRGVLADREDIFFLELPELRPLVAGLAQGTAIAARKAEFAYHQTLTPPTVIVGQFEPERLAPQDAAAETGVLRGLPASAGVATGPARVVIRPDPQQRVLPGEILVAPFTDPGWTPYFLAAAGIVMDVGGMLSHGSIVAREYGIPAVVNVGRATRLIETGQIVRVDGIRGIVTILDPADAAENQSKGGIG
jgi:pyruvate,water dikinase